MTLTELQKQITPLPWIWDGANLICEQTGETVAINPRSGSNRKWIEQGRLSLDYARHCANHFPALVEALQKIRDSKAINVLSNPGELMILEQALATAETVKEL